MYEQHHFMNAFIIYMCYTHQYYVADIIYNRSVEFNCPTLMCARTEFIAIILFQLGAQMCIVRN